MDGFSKMTKYKDPQKPQAASHMFWFFIIPAIVFMGWVSWTLLGGLNKKTEVKSSLVNRVQEIRDGKSAGARYQAAYSFAQDLQREIHSEKTSLEPAEKDKLFSSLGSLLEEFPEDARLRRYLILTLAQLKDVRAIKVFQQNLADPDEDIRFYSAWGFIEALNENKDQITDKHLELVATWLNHKELSYKKIATSFLVHYPEYQTKVKSLLSDENKEVQWNAAVALASQKNAAGKNLINEMLQLHTIRSISFRSSRDLEQFVATALEATKNLNDPELARAALSLREKVSDQNSEGRAVNAAFKGFKMEDIL
ncbi:HEAT repeat domain-containing protein [bacterium]|nr:HEAT repeat domain-containing protein [bacterium]